MQLIFFLLIVAMMVLIVVSSIHREVIEGDPLGDVSKNQAVKRHVMMFALLVGQKLTEKAEEDHRLGITDNPTFDRAFEEFQKFDGDELVKAVLAGKDLAETALTPETRAYLGIGI
jgi:hypothetical protein